MMTTVTDEREIQQCQVKLSQFLKKELTNHGRFTFGSPYGTFKHTIHYNDEIWWYYEKWQEKYHVNLFGFPLLHPNKSNVEDLTITIPLKDIDRRPQGVFVQDTENNNYLLMHRGRFHRRSKDNFYKFFGGKSIIVFDGNKKEELFYVTNISNEQTILIDIIAFMHQVVKFKIACPVKK